MYSNILEFLICIARENYFKPITKKKPIKNMKSRRVIECSIFRHKLLGRFF